MKSNLMKIISVAEWIFEINFWDIKDYFGVLILRRFSQLETRFNCKLSRFCVIFILMSLIKADFAPILPIWRFLHIKPLFKIKAHLLGSGIYAQMPSWEYRSILYILCSTRWTLGRHEPTVWGISLWRHQTSHETGTLYSLDFT